MTHPAWLALVCAWALLFALVEIEIEGEHGWAAQLPTFHVGGPIPRLTGKPLTGYHVFMVPIPAIRIGDHQTGTRVPHGI